jgi:hypothetical protein
MTCFGRNPRRQAAVPAAHLQYLPTAEVRETEQCVQMCAFRIEDARHGRILVYAGPRAVVNDETPRAIRPELDAEALAAAWEAGWALDLEEAVALGLGEA